MTNKVDRDNSSVALLSAAGVFTAPVADVERYNSATIFCDSDQDGSLVIQYSTDGTNFDLVKTITLDTSISSTEAHTVSIPAKYFRVVYTNGAVDQTHFRLQTVFHEGYVGTKSISSGGVLTDTADVTLVRATNDFTLDVARGLDSNKEEFRSFSFNEAVPNGTYADIWNYGGTLALYPFPVAAETLRVKAGGNAADTAAGAGARTISVSFLDATGVKVTETISLLGALVSLTTSSTATRLISAKVLTTGTIRATNTADIIIENSTTGNIVGVIPADHGKTFNSHYTVPLDHTAYLTSIHIDVEAGTTKDADVHMWARNGALTFSAPFENKYLVKEWTSFQGESNIRFDALPVFPALTDIWFEAKGNGAVTGVDIDYSLITIHN